ncbi:MAG: hypothetical protein AAF639_13655 [Chloroflexota bacterium]
MCWYCKRRCRFYQWQLRYLEAWLDRIERQWDNALLKEECVQSWQENTWLLWEVAPKPVRKFITVLTQSATKLNAQTLSTTQVAALRNALHVVRDADPSDMLIGTAYQQLIESGLSPRLSFDSEFVQLYLDEL